MSTTRATCEQQQKVIYNIELTAVNQLRMLWRFVFAGALASMHTFAQGITDEDAVSANRRLFDQDDKFDDIELVIERAATAQLEVRCWDDRAGQTSLPTRCDGQGARSMPKYDVIMYAQVVRTVAAGHACY